MDLIVKRNKCLGAFIFDKQKEKVLSISAGSIILATGGASKAYLYTSNPDGASGDGYALAWRAGCRLENMELSLIHI